MPNEAESCRNELHVPATRTRCARLDLDSLVVAAPCPNETRRPNIAFSFGHDASTLATSCRLSGRPRGAHAGVPAEITDSMCFPKLLFSVNGASREGRLCNASGQDKRAQLTMPRALANMR